MSTCPAVLYWEGNDLQCNGVTVARIATDGIVWHTRIAFQPESEGVAFLTDKDARLHIEEQFNIAIT